MQIYNSATPVLIDLLMADRVCVCFFPLSFQGVRDSVSYLLIFVDYSNVCC